MFGIYILIFVALCFVALTKHRVWVLCGFYCVYGVLKVIALGDVIEWRDLVLFQGLYLVMFGSLVIRWYQDDSFRLQIGLWPKNYLLAVSIMFVSALYSIS